MAEFWDLSASELASGVLAYQAAKTAAKPTADARLTAVGDTSTIDGRTTAVAQAAGVPMWALYLGAAALVFFMLKKA